LNLSRVRVVVSATSARRSLSREGEGPTLGLGWPQDTIEKKLNYETPAERFDTYVASISSARRSKQTLAALIIKASFAGQSGYTMVLFGWPL